MLKFKPGNLDKPRSFVKIYEGENLIRDFVVCINPDGKIGVYDLVNEKFTPFDNCVVVRNGDYITLYTEAEYENLINMINGKYPYTEMEHEIGQYIDLGIRPTLKGEKQ